MIENAFSVANILPTVVKLVETGFSIIQGNEIMMVTFGSGLVGAGFRLIRQGKKAVR